MPDQFQWPSRPGPGLKGKERFRRAAQSLLGAIGKRGKKMS
jgi:hypothetical protein